MLLFSLMKVILLIICFSLLNKRLRSQRFQLYCLSLPRWKLLSAFVASWDCKHEKCVCFDWYWFDISAQSHWGTGHHSSHAALCRLVRRQHAGFNGELPYFTFIFFKLCMRVVTISSRSPAQPVDSYSPSSGICVFKQWYGCQCHGFFTCT